MPASKSSGSLRNFETAVVFVLSTAIAVFWAQRAIRLNQVILDGDAEAHLNIARRLWDSRTPGPEQIGTSWLPLPHLLLAPLTFHDAWWKSGQAGLILSAAAFVLAATFLYLGAHRVFDDMRSAGVVLLPLFFSVNVAYLATTPMTEMLFAAGLAILLWATLWFRDSQSIWAILIAAAASNAASLTRYEGWILIPFVAGYLLLVAERKSLALLFAALAALAPLSWLAHNEFYYGNALEFYNGPWSAMAIHQRQTALGVIYPTAHNWRAAMSFYFEAVRLIAGTPFLILAAVGAVAEIVRRVWWPLVLLAVAPVFYVISLHSGSADLYVPTFWPHTYYNTRYAFAGLLLVSFAAAGVIFILPEKFARYATFAFVLITVIPSYAGGPKPVILVEPELNSQGRRDAQHQAAVFLAAAYLPGSGVLFPFGQLAGVLREAGIPLREGLHDGNHPQWDLASLRPGAFLREEWAIATPGDEVSTMVHKAVEQGRSYRLRKRVDVKDSPVIEIYHLE